MDPDSFEIFYLRAYFDDFLGNFLIDCNVGVPVGMCGRTIVIYVEKVVKLWSNHVFVEQKKSVNLLYRHENWETLLFVKDLARFGLISFL